MKKINQVYIIDDDPITVFGIRRILNEIDICDSINTYSHGKLAIDDIKKIHDKSQKLPEVIFLDINMPIMDGWQFLEEFISLPIEDIVRINILTSSIDAIDLQKWECYNSKTHHDITFNRKPMHKNELAEITKVA